MKLIRFEREEKINFGIIQGDKVQALRGPPTEPLHLEELWPLGEVTLLAPILPSKIIAVGLNYRGHAKELSLKTTSDEPLIFLKPPSALNGPEQPILLPEMSQRVDFEGELAVVLGQRAKNLSEAEASKAILGYSCFNDVTARDLQFKDVQFTRAKAFDTFACLGPWIETELDPKDLKIETRVNGEVKQSARTSEMVFSVPRILSFISRIMTLEAGDVVITGTPSGVGPLENGDTVEVTIEGIGTLSNPVLHVE
ncbi:MAG: fumarylacetoacetate hydrolase family protein [Deltaproteobacteria bacterium]|nr:fumarylacetoacetate hydrolase family protein [Deltaproteobacteria bacterium]